MLLCNIRKVTHFFQSNSLKAAETLRKYFYLHSYQVSQAAWMCPKITSFGNFVFANGIADNLNVTIPIVVRESRN